jgi:hypothetical protein
VAAKIYFYGQQLIDFYEKISLDTKLFKEERKELISFTLKENIMQGKTMEEVLNEEFHKAFNN